MSEYSTKFLNLEPLVGESKAKVTKSIVKASKEDTVKEPSILSSSLSKKQETPSVEAFSSKKSTDLSSFEELRNFSIDLIEISKPGIMVLLLISTACPMILAGSGRLDYKLFFWTMLGGGLVSASASAMNCIWDRDIDAIMQRTKNRAIAAGRLSPEVALLYAICVGVIGLWVMTYCVNPLAAFLSLIGHLFYVLVYTIFLKRSTVQNIVIGGAAGSVPPLVGWAAVQDSLNLTAWLLFFIVFFWTPPHFWALAINKNSDYKKAKIPMLPVISGHRITTLQMLIYAVLLIPFSVCLVYSDQNLGYFSLISLVLLGVIFSYLIVQLLSLVPKKSSPSVKDRLLKLEEYFLLEKFVGDSFLEDSLSEAGRVQAWKVFKFSLLYLAFFFFCLVIDSSIL